MLMTQAAHDAPASLNWNQVESQLSQHRQLVRMCGPLSAARALSLMDHNIDLAAWLEPFASSKSAGVPIRTVLNLCQRYEPNAHIVQAANRSTHRLPLPCILFVNDSRHCVVAQSLSKSGVRIWDPSDLREKTISSPKLRSIWSGHAICLRKQNRWTVRRASLLSASIITWSILLRLTLRWKRINQQARSEPS